MSTPVTRPNDSFFSKKGQGWLHAIFAMAILHFIFTAIVGKDWFNGSSVLELVVVFVAIALPLSYMAAKWIGVFIEKIQVKYFQSPAENETDIKHTAYGGPIALVLFALTNQWTDWPLLIISAVIAIGCVAYWLKK